MKGELWYLCLSYLFGHVVPQSDTDKAVKIGIIKGAESHNWLPHAAGLWPKLQALAGVTADYDIKVIEVHIRDLQPHSYQQLVEEKNRFQTQKISAIVGHFDVTMAMLADDLGIPYLVTSSPQQTTWPHHNFTFYMLPPPGIVHSAVKDIVDAYRWRESAVLYDDDTDLALIGALMSTKSLVRGWRLGDDVTDAELLDYLLDIRQLHISNVIVSCHVQRTRDILDTGLRLSMLSERYSWIIVHLNSGEIDYSRFNYTGVNMTSFELVSQGHGVTPERRAWSDQMRVWMSSTTGAAGLDAFLLLSYYFAGQESRNCKFNCNDVLERGRSLTALQKISFNGFTGYVEFDDKNERSNISLEIKCMLQQGFVTNGIWNSKPANESRNRLQFSKKQALSSDGKNLLGHQIAKVVTVIDPPFVMLKKNSGDFRGNDRYEGYLVDLLHVVAERLNFRYEIYECPDGNYGSYDKEKDEWNGMVKELIDGNASMCLAAIAITSERERVIDFAKPYKDLTFSILMKRPEKKSSIFQFLWPLHPIVWGLTVATMIIIGLLLYIIEKCNNRQREEHKFPLRECLWFIYGSLVGAGTEMIPRTLSSRLLSGAWWFFSLILISSYTANLAAFLTVTRIETPINSLNDLAEQSDIKYGTVSNTYAASFFKNSKIEAFKKMWTFMSELHPDCLVDNSSVGLKKVLEGGYAFLWDAPINKYVEMTECETMVVGQPFDRKGYGIGVPLHAAYRDALTIALLHINEEGTIQELERKWWDSGKCEEFNEVSTGGTKELTIHNVAGIFVVLAAGVFLSVCVCIGEFLMHRSRNDQKKRAKKYTINDGSSLVPLAPTGGRAMNENGCGLLYDNNTNSTQV